LKAKRKLKIILTITLILFLVVLINGCASDSQTGASPSSGGQSVASTAGDQDNERDEGADPLAQLLGSRSQSLQIVGLLTILSIAPALLIMLTGFTRIIIVLSLTRNALGLQQMPPNQVLVALALFLTFFVMSPVFNQIKTEALDPYINQQITAQEAIDTASVPIKEFMLKQTYKSDLELFVDISRQEDISNVDSIPMSTVIPAFITSEIKRGFQIGFFIYIPFIVIDMVVASTLMAMGMMMLPPTVISLPFKVLLFVLVDGWALTVQTLISSFN
jgi:flagellar biosynthetic protein FliP